MTVTTWASTCRMVACHRARAILVDGREALATAPGRAIRLEIKTVNRAACSIRVRLRSGAFFGRFLRPAAGTVTEAAEGCPA